MSDSVVVTQPSDAAAEPAVEGRQLATDFALLARALQAAHGVQETLDAICALAVHSIAGAEHAGITVRRGGRFETPAATDTVSPTVDSIQYRTGQGPCVDAIATQATVRLEDVATEKRWPAFTARLLAETDVRSMLAFRLFVQDDTLGALNLYADHPHAFGSPVHETLGAVFAAHAAMALSAALEADHGANLEQALLTNRRIGTAIGILMSRRRLTEDAAFDVLRTASQHRNRKLHDVADDVVVAGDLVSPA